MMPMPVEGMSRRGENLHLAVGVAPGVLGHFAEFRRFAGRAVGLQRLGVVDQRHHRLGVKNHRRGAQRSAAWTHLILGLRDSTRSSTSQLSRSERGRFGSSYVVEIVVLLEQAAILPMLVGPADLVADKPADAAGDAAALLVQRRLA